MTNYFNLDQDQDHRLTSGVELDTPTELDQDHGRVCFSALWCEILRLIIMERDKPME